MPPARDPVKKKVKRKPSSQVRDVKSKADLGRAKTYHSEVRDTKGDDLRRGQRAAEPIIRQERIKVLRKRRKGIDPGEVAESVGRDVIRYLTRSNEPPGLPKRSDTVGDALDVAARYLGDKALSGGRDQPGLPRRSEAVSEAFDEAAREAGRALGKVAEIQARSKAPKGAHVVDPKKSGVDVGLRGEALLQTARAHVEKPSTAIKTLRQVPAAAAGTVGLIGSGVVDPKGTLKDVDKQGTEDAKRRLDALRKGDPEEFRDRIKQEGGLAEFSEGAVLLTGLGGTLGRIAGLSLRTRGVGPYATPRPKLRTTAGGPAQDQPLSGNVLVAYAQKGRDRSRESAYAKRKAHSEETMRKATPTSRGEAGTVRSLEPGEGEVVRRSLKRQARDQRKAVAGDIGRGYVRLKSKQRTELKEGTRKNLRTLSDDEIRGFKYAIQLGIRDPQTARKALQKHRSDIEANREGVEILRTDEIPEIDYLIANADKAFTDRLAKVAIEETERARRAAELAPSLTLEQAELRRRKPQAELLGVQPKKGESVAEFIARVDRVAQRNGLDVPGYYLSRERPEGVNAAFSLGQTKAVKPSRRYEGELFRTGREDTSPDAFETGLARNIREGVNWNTIADVWERNSPEWGRNRGLVDLKREIERRGLDPDGFRLVNLGVFRRNVPDADTPDLRDADLNQTGDSRLHKAIENATHDLAGAESEFGRNARFTLIPKAVADELRALSRPAGPVSRTVRKIQGQTSRVLLHTNPTFVPVQILAQTPLALFATRANVRSIVGSQRWYRRLDRDSRQVVDEWIGSSPGLDAAFSPRYGAAAPDSKFVKFFQAVADSRKAQAAKNSRLNPFTWNPRLDEAQNRFFRTAVFYDAARRQARDRMARAMNDVADDAKPVIDILAMPEGPEKLAALRQAEPEIEKIAGHVDDWLGNYTRYTAAERRYLKTGLLFYGFLRWSVRFSLYTLPVKHPLAASIATRLGQLHVEEVIDLLTDEVMATYGGEYDREDVERILRENRIPGAFGRIYFTGDGQLKSIDLARVSPFTGPALNFLERGTKAIGGLMSPALQWGMDLVYGKSSFTGQPLNVNETRTPFGGEPELGTDETVRYVFREGTRLAWPVRALDDLLNPEDQGDDSIPILGDRPLPPPKSDDALLRYHTRVQRRRDEGLQRAVKPFAGPITDTTSAGIRYELERQNLDKPKPRKPRKLKKRPAADMFGPTTNRRRNQTDLFGTKTPSTTASGARDIFD